MNRSIKFIIWAAGFLLLIFLIQFPIQESEEASETSTPWSLPLSGKTIVIDPGHGGVDGGAVGKDETLEKDIALSISKKLQSYLHQSGALVYLTREEDVDLAAEDTEGYSRRKMEDIRNRLQFIHDQEADFFLSLHLNALPSDKWSGAQTFYYPEQDESRHLAQMIQSEIIRNLENTDRTPLANNGVYLLKNAEIPGALVEVGFLSNEQERELLKQDEYQQRMSASIYEGILRYATEEMEESNE
ncbi:N-acetylmuramoyl-L-alanine amidase [Virgibacillus natechei]|uniref:N-acetylmuramoyl-L-alanine amidase n=1 Tax=Virgibacillus natechei TaxID=1216297 RepID=A0ABS4IJ39_9BACI|nr:N-acetylmuramoyl-L-alanine amidase CwlD [Virgibacillus natechei]MBP1970936.1 N-acetylmuramoyl-L-alanine amidase [Virgibacillus natechei]UZD13313.1 N-acetylmuramoyl-L-alanine amidase CwlD [Virgibacillus natechei]